ncbi:hypothetical protein [Clostridium beijerinckii]|uniref:hypothetical protein n=1 Tax=Clostridium beijerinckii TaxID=1520 RepID=UPI0014940661|nr:hypothetical protein [Clostridium beijerinckii]
METNIKNQLKYDQRTLFGSFIITINKKIKIIVIEQTFISSPYDILSIKGGFTNRTFDEIGNYMN